MAKKKTITALEVNKKLQAARKARRGDDDTQYRRLVEEAIEAEMQYKKENGWFE